MILVTGAGGFAGSRIMTRLVDEGQNPRGLVRDATRARQRLPASGYELVAGDTTKPETLAAAVEGVDTIIHTAFITADRKQGPGVNYYETNVRGTNNLLDAAKRAGVRRIVELGGLGTKPAKPGSYMQGRWAADEAIKSSGLAWSILGPSIQFGSGSAFFTGLADLVKSAPAVPMVGNGKRLFQPIWVDDVARAIVLMATLPQRYDGRVIEIGGPQIFSYAQILDLIMQTLGTRKPKVPGPTPLVAIGAAVMEAVLPKPPITVAAVGLFSFDNVAQLDGVEREFGFQPRALPPYLNEHGID